MTTEDVLKHRNPVEPLASKPMPPDLGFWGKIPTMAKWSYIMETEGEGYSYGAGAFGQTLCKGRTSTWKQAAKFLEREREQGAARLFRSQK